MFRSVRRAAKDRALEDASKAGRGRKREASISSGQDREAENRTTQKKNLYSLMLKRTRNRDG